MIKNSLSTDREEHLKSKVKVLQSLFAVLSVCGCLVGSKLVPLRLFGTVLLTPASTFCFAIVFFIQNTISELSSRANDDGKVRALEAIHIGVFSQITAASLFLLVRFLPAHDPQYQESYNLILGSSWILLGSSVTAYLISTRVVAYLFNLLRARFSPGLANSISSQLGNLADTVIFTLLAFGIGQRWLFEKSGLLSILSLIATQFVIKFVITGLLSILFPVFFRKHNQSN